MDSRGQISIFMILAFIVLLLGVLFFIYQETIAGDTEVVQEEVQPVYTFVENCIKTVAEQGLTIIGLTGGYIDVPDNILRDHNAYLDASPQGLFKLPYWWFDGFSAIPPLDFVKSELARYMEDELAGCFNEFQELTTQFTFEAVEEPIIVIQLNENDVQFEVDYPLKVFSKKNNSIHTLRKFKEVVNIRFKKAYDMAVAIMQQENDDWFFEDRVIDLMAMDPNEIPITELEIDCTPKFWQDREVKNRIQELVSINIPFIKIVGTDYNTEQWIPNPFTENDVFSESYYQTHYIWDIGREDWDGLEASFTYDPVWPTNFNVRPSEGGIMKANAQQGQDILKFFCIQTYHFTYDVGVPIKVAVFDDETIEHKAYLFNFAFKINVDHNYPNRENRGYTLFEVDDFASSEEFCADEDHEVTVFTINNATGEDLRGVDVSYTCGPFRCEMGETEWIGFGAAGGLTTNYPHCVNGILRGNKEGYLESKQFIQTDKGGQSVILLMTPLKEILKVNIVKHPLAQPGDYIALSPDEKVAINLKALDTNYETFAVVPVDEGFPLQLLAGKEHSYEVSVRLIVDGELRGGYQGTWEVNPTTLDGANEITFHVLEEETRNEDALFDFLNLLEFHSTTVPKPELS